MSVSAAVSLAELTALGPAGEYRTRNRELIRATTGVPLAELHLVPSLYVARTVTAQRKAAPLPAADRAAALTAAADVFETSTIAGLDFDAYVLAAARVSGLPIAVTRAGAREVAAAVRHAVDAVRPAQPTGAVTDVRDVPAGAGTAVWARRGEVFAVQASGNAPGVHGGWPQALALGYRVAVRPSRREPFTGHRLVHALRTAGFPPEHVSFLPTDRAGADGIVDAADLAVVYGGPDLVDKYAAVPTVFVNGPGRTKILITAEQDWRAHLDLIVDSVSALAGTACMNATAVLYEGDPAPLAEAVAQRLSALQPLPNTDEAAVLPTQPRDSAQALADCLRAKAIGTVPVLSADQVVADVGDGPPARRPPVHHLHTPHTTNNNHQQPLPSVWVSGWSRSDGTAPLRDSLVLSVLTSDDDLVDELLGDSTIANVYRGATPTYHSSAEIPHDGFLADFLMRTKGFCNG